MNFSKKAEYTCRNCLELSRGRAGPWAFAQICVLLRIMLLDFLAVGQKLSNGASIRYDEQTQVFRIDAADISYVLGVNENKRVQTLYWGRRLSAFRHLCKTTLRSQAVILRLVCEHNALGVRCVGRRTLCGT